MSSLTASPATLTPGEKWITLLSNYAAHEDGAAKALFHERMERYIAELQIPPIDFKHPMEDEVMSLFDAPASKWPNIILAGDAGVGKTRLVHKVYAKMGGDPKRLAGRGAYWQWESVAADGTPLKIDINRDLSASRTLGATHVSSSEAARLEEWSRLLLGIAGDGNPHRIFVVAANDGQMLKAWKDYAELPIVAKALELLENALKNGPAVLDGLPLRLFHMASVGTDQILERCLNAVLEHPGWDWLEADHSGRNDLFSEMSPLKRNYLGLCDSTFRKRLLDLGRLCDANEWHFPVRNVLAVFANALLGFQDQRKTATTTLDLAKLRALIADGRSHRSNFFANVFGLNLGTAWRERTLGPLESFRVGLETSNHADGLILFGAEDDDYKPDYEAIFTRDPVFPPDPHFEEFRKHYLSTGPSQRDGENTLQQQLIAQRRRLFFRIPPELEAKYDPWSLTNFHHSKAYLEEVLEPIQAGRNPLSKHLATLIVALNRVWTGLLLEERDQLFVTTALDFATGVASEIEVRRIPTKATSGGDHPYVDLDRSEGITKRPRISVYLKPGEAPVSLFLTLTRFEFLMRVASGALPSSFSRECSDDMRAFKSQVLAKLPLVVSGSIKLLHVNDDGSAGRMAINLYE